MAAGKTGRPTSGLKKGDVTRKVREMGAAALADRDMAGLGADKDKRRGSAFDKKRGGSESYRIGMAQAREAMINDIARTRDPNAAFGKALKIKQTQGHMIDMLRGKHRKK